jgi:translation initiation factor eIF-2B subunit alpha
MPGDDDEDKSSYSSHHHSSSSSLFDKTAMAVPVAAIKALLGVVQRSRAETMMGLQDELKQATQEMKDRFDQILVQQTKSTNKEGVGGGEEKGSDRSRSSAAATTTLHPRRRSQIALQSGCELFLKYITRTFLELPDFAECRRQVLERGERFHMISLAARDSIAHVGADFVGNNTVVLTHGWSRVVAAILLQASRNPQNKHFQLIVLEGRPDMSGAKAAVCYAQETSIPITVVTDAAMAYVMERVDMVLVGAEGVLENGGVVNKIGTYALATCAKAAGKPFYVAAESYKFARLYPFRQSDLPQTDNSYAPMEFYETTSSKTDAPATKIEMPANVTIENPSTDFTPSNYITLLFTDLGVLTPSAVSDELIRLYQ